MEPQPAIQLDWHGPFGWPGFALESGLTDLETAAVAQRCGVYLWSVEHVGGFLIYAAGVTRRSFCTRFREHSRAYRQGVYTVFDAKHLQRGERKKVWPGFWFRKRLPEMEQDYLHRAPEISAARGDLLSAYRVFVAPLAPEPRVLERIEAAIMGALYAAGGAAAVIPDRGMALSPRRPDEPALLVRSTSAVVMHGLPNELEA